MRMFEFAVIASGLDPRAEDFEDRFFAAGCNDATISFQNGEIVLEFARAGETFENAVRSALQHVVQAGAKPLRIDAQVY